MSNQPVTPLSRNAPHVHAHSISHSHFRTPVSPASPYTPMSLRSFASSNSSVLVTPRSDSKAPPPGARRLSMSASQTHKSYLTSPSHGKEKRYADVAHSWRSRANDNGIRVAAAHDDFYGGDDSFGDQSFSDADDSGFLIQDDVAATPDMMATRRRRTVSQSQDMLPSSFSSRPLPTSPLSRRNPPRVQMVTQTPPPNRTLAKQIKLKGSQTAPAQPRKRQALGNVSLASPNVPAAPNPDISSNLFNIDESYEYEHDMDNIHDPDASYDFFASSPPKQENYQVPTEYQSFPLMNALPTHLTAEAMFGQPAFADSFAYDTSRMAPSMMESVQQHMQPFHPRIQSWGLPATAQSFVPPTIRPINLPTPSHVSTQQSIHATSRQAANSPLPQSPPKTCSVCSRTNPTRLAILSPCHHPLCSACLTSALNIVGEKDMECAVCKKSVDDFKLISLQPTLDNVSNEGGKRNAKRTSTPNGTTDDSSKSDHYFADPTFSSPGSNGGGLDSAFELLGPFGTGSILSSTPPRRTATVTLEPLKEAIVLRIDNVPWDITPASISTWLEQPVLRAHVLLDRKGKTMSHAFVEVESTQIAGAILRGETQKDATGMGKQGRSAVLGRGRRARGVTITRSSQEELMSSLFPTWHGSFTGAQPTMLSPSGMHPARPQFQGSRVSGQVEGGLMSESEIASLLYLIRSPDAHFLKVPSLPFHVLMSILSKLPSDRDNRLYSSAPLRDTLYAAVQILQLRIKEREQKSLDIVSDGEYTMDLLNQLIHVGRTCKAFTPFQSTKIGELVDGTYEDAHDGDDMVEDDGSSNAPTYMSPDSSVSQSSSATDQDKHAALAREFGLDAQLVQALAERLGMANRS